MILPLRVLGSMSTKFSSPITATGPELAAHRGEQLLLAARRTARVPCFSTTKAEMTSPRSSSGRPVTPASATAGWRRKAVSTSMVPMRWAAILMISSARPLNQT